MITALQSARLKAANDLYAARCSILSCVSSVVWQNEEGFELKNIAEHIDQLLAKLVPNTKTGG